MTYCYKCGQEYRTVYRKGAFLDLNTADDKRHSLTCGNRKAGKQAGQTHKPTGSICNKCGARIFWKWGPKGRYPTNSDGSEHWPTCRKPYSGPLTKHTGSTTGKDYRQIQHRDECKALPWETCGCGER